MKECVDFIKEKSEDEIQDFLEKLEIDKVKADTNIQTITDLKDPRSMNRQEGIDAINYLMNGFFFPIFSVLEGNFDCQGICEPSNFYMTRDVTDGPPESNCLIPVSRYAKSMFSTFGVIILILFLYLFSIMVLGCCSCRKFKDDPECWVGFCSNKRDL